MRVVVGTAIISHAIIRLNANLPVKSAAIQLFAIAVGLALSAGFWTPVTGLLVMIFGTWGAFTQARDPWANILLASIGIAVALIGPGAFSLDAWLFGWKRIDIQDRKR